jgi:putative addiction module component (TIGR02574 family)
MPDAPEPAGFDALKIDEKIDLIERLWDRVADTPDEVPIPVWHREVVRERLAAHRRAPDEAVSWDDVRRDLDELLRRRSA